MRNKTERRPDGAFFFIDRMFEKQFAPALVSALGLAFSDMMDAVVVGQRMGETGLAAISLALPVFMVLNVLMHGMGLGASLRFGARMAEGKTGEATAGLWGALLATLGMGLILTAAGRMFLTPLLALLGTTPADGELFAAARTYLSVILSAAVLFFFTYFMNYSLRNDDHERLAGLGFTAGNLCDIALNILLVLVLDCGAAGAAWATVAGQLVTAGIYLFGMALRPHALRLPFGRGRRVRPAFGGAAGCFVSGFATSGSYLCSMLFLLVSNRVLLARLGSAGVASFDVVQNVSFLVTYLYESAVKAAQPLFALTRGEHDLPGQRRAGQLALRSGMAAGGAAVLFAAAFPAVPCAVFGLTDPEAAGVAGYALRVYCLGALPAGLNVIGEGCLQASGDEKTAGLITALRGAAVLIPVTLFCVSLGGRFFWWLYPATELLTLLGAGLYRRFLAEPAADLPPERVCRMVIRSSAGELAGLVGGAEEFCRRFGASEKQVQDVALILEELSAVILQKGFSGGDGYLQVTLSAEEDGFVLHLRDSAVSFDPFSLHTGKKVEAADFDPDALGILLVRSLAKEFSYRRFQGFNTLVVKV